MKKALYFFASLLALEGGVNIPAIASNQQVSPFSFVGQGHFRIGIELEYLNLEAKLKENYAPFGSNLQSDRSQTKKRVLIAPSIELGATILNDYYLGIRASWHEVDTKTKSRAYLKQTTYLSHYFKINQYGDILVKPGYKLTPQTMIYGLIGPSIIKWSHATDQLRRISTNAPLVRDDSFKVSKTSVGLGLGFGLEYFIRNQYFLGIDYVHHLHESTFHKKTMTFLENFDGGPNNLIVVPRKGDVTKKITPSYSTIAVRLSVPFRVW